ncbi:predicted protein, partial [Nematostella vectensis]
MWNNEDEFVFQGLEGLPEIPAATIAEFKEAFSLFDADGSGTITVEELSTVMKNLGEKVDDCELKQMVSEVDEDGSGEIDFDEFCEMMWKKMNQEEEEGTIIDAFNAWDETGTGMMKIDDLKNMLRKLQAAKLSKSEIDKMCQVIDPSGTGQFKFQ